MNKAISRTLEDYLATIYRLEKHFGIARTTDIAKSLKVSLGTVTNTLVKLKALSLIEHEPFKGIKLTEKGREIALRIIRRHRLIERFLTDVLKVEWYKVHDLAHKLEHDIEELEEYIEKILGSPEFCPHGNPIKFDKVCEEGIKLSEAKINKKYVVIRVSMEDTDLLRLVDELNLKPGNIVEVLSRNNYVIIAKIENKLVKIASNISSIIAVKEV